MKSAMKCQQQQQLLNWKTCTRLNQLEKPYEIQETIQQKLDTAQDIVSLIYVHTNVHKPFYKSIYYYDLLIDSRPHDKTAVLNITQV